MQKAEELKEYISILKQQKRITRINSLKDAVHFNKASENIGELLLLFLNFLSNII